MTKEYDKREKKHDKRKKTKCKICKIIKLGWRCYQQELRISTGAGSQSLVTHM